MWGIFYSTPDRIIAPLCSAPPLQKGRKELFVSFCRSANLTVQARLQRAYRENNPTEVRLFSWYTRQDLNLWPLAPQANALSS